MPTRYEVNIVLHGVRHEYGFELDDEQVLQEWAHYYPRGKAALLFHRQTQWHALDTQDNWRRTVLIIFQIGPRLPSTVGRLRIEHLGQSDLHAGRKTVIFSTLVS